MVSDHHPVSGTININVITPYIDDGNNDVKQKVAWDKLPDSALEYYEHLTEKGFDSIIIPDGVKCIDANCQVHSHVEDIYDLYDSIVNVLSSSSERISRKHNGTSQRRGIPGWNEHVKELHDAARDAYLLWKDSGKPRQGVAYELMRHSRSQFKHSLRVCKNRKNTIIADNIAANLCKKDDRAFWGEIKKMTNSKIKLPSMIGNANGNDAINTMWQEHYSNIFNSVKGSSCEDIHAAMCMEHIVFDRDMIVSSSEIVDIIADMSCNKSPGLDGLTSEHMKFANSKLPVLLSILMSAVLIHGHVPRSAMRSVLVPIIKNKNKRITDKDNYRPIRLSNVFTKVIEKVLLCRMQGWLSTTSNLFGFKHKHGTDICVFTLKELIRYYIKHGSCMYVAYLDASKAFDRVNQNKLFIKLMNIGVPKWIIKVISQWYCNQILSVKWGSLISDVFPVTNGVRQGGILSPLLFNVYINDLSRSLSKLPIGCCSGENVVNHLMYADDIVLLSPSAKGMQRLLDNAYAYGCDYDILFNSKKSQLMIFDTMKLGYDRHIILGEAPLTVTNSYKYLGHIITDNLSDEADLEDKERGLYRRCNALLRTFHFCSDEVKNKLFTCYCSNVYLCSLWVKFRKSAMHHFIVSYNNAFRIVHGLPMRCSASGMFASSGVSSCQASFRRSVYSLQCRLHASLNLILHNIINCDVHLTSSLHKAWLRTLHSNTMHL